jgi:two-component sensor histidine kinase
VALLPLGVISLLQANAWLAAARDQRAAILFGDTLRVSAPVTGLIQEAQGTAESLALTVGSFLEDEAVCDAVMTRIKENSRSGYSVVSFVPITGRMTCASDGASFDYSGIPLFEAILADLRPAVYVQAEGPVSGTSVILIIEPVPEPSGSGSLGYVAVAIPHSALGLPNGPPQARDANQIDPSFMTFNESGEVLTSTDGSAFEPAALPLGVDLSDLATRNEQTSFTAPTARGEERLYTVVPVIEGRLFALGSVPAREAVRLGPVSIFTPFLLAALMWGGSLVVAWLAAERLVTRYIRRLGRAIRAFASGSRVVGDLDMEGAPAELEEVGQAFLRMTDTILHDEAELEDTVHQREVLLREVHHRVKNNLQLIASIMNMQMRRAKSPETKTLMKGLQDRVMSLATVHKELYQTSGLTDVRADELLSDLVRQIVGMASGPGRTFRIETDFAPVPLAPDQAVPLSLLLTEGLTNAIKYAAPDPGEASPRISLRFLAENSGRAMLTIENTAPETAPSPSEGTGLGSQLVSAFASQLGGEVQSEIRDRRFLLRMEFTLSSLRGAEQRHSG